MAEHLTEDGMSFLAVEIGVRGEWSRHVDLQKCISKISNRPTYINLYYTHFDCEVGELGGLNYDLRRLPISLGVYQIKGKRNTFSLKGLDQEMSKIVHDKNFQFQTNKEMIDHFNESLQEDLRNG